MGTRGDHALIRQREYGCDRRNGAAGGELVSSAGLFERRSVRVSVAICVLGVGFAILDAETNGTRGTEQSLSSGSVPHEP